MASLQSNITIDKLTQDNYHTWMVDVKFILNQLDGLNITEGTEVRPIINDTDPESKAEAKDYDRRSRLALSTIFLNLTPQFKTIIQHCKTPKEAWLLLNQHFEPDTRSRHMQLFTEFFNCKIHQNEPVNMFAARIRKINECLKGINQEMPEIYRCFQLIRYLPSEFSPLVQSILRWDDEKFKFSKILTELVAEETRLTVMVEDQKLTENFEASSSTSRYRSRQRKFQINKPRSPSATRRNKTPVRRVRFQETRQTSPQSRWKSNSRKTDKSYREINFVCEASYTGGEEFRHEWILDSAATHHFCRDLWRFKNKQQINDRNLAVATTGKSIPIKYRGEVTITLDSGKSLFMERTLYVPNLRRNIISLSLLDQLGYQFEGGDGKIDVYDENDEYVFTAINEGGIYHLIEKNPPKPPKVETELKQETQNRSKPKRRAKKKKPQKTEVLNTKVSNNNQLATWHKRLGHLNTDLISHSGSNKSVRGLPNLKPSKFFCEDCKINQAKRVPFKQLGKIRSSQPLDLLHLDLWGPAPVKGYNGARYYLSITDDFSRRIALYTLQEKSQAFDAFQYHVAQAERFLSKRVKAIRTDNGGEFDNMKFRQYCNHNGITHEFTDVYAPEMNGVAERLNQTIGNSVRTILNSSKVPHKFWPEAVRYAAYCWNRICRRNSDKTPFELYGGHSPAVKHMKPFGSTCFIGVPKQRRTKFDQRAQKGIMVGYSSRIKGYRVLLPETGKVVESRNVTFAEQEPNFYQSLNMQNGSGAVMGTNENNSTTYTLKYPSNVSFNIPHHETSQATPSTSHQPV